MSTEELTEQVAEDAKATVTVSNDKMEAYVLLTAPIAGGKPVSVQLVMDALAEAGVVHGINAEIVNAIVESPQYFDAELVANATPPADGKDAVIHFLFPLTSEGKPKEMPDGSVDFKQLDIIKNVTAGEAVCNKTPAVIGRPGVDVKGGVLAAVQGNDLPLPAGPNTVESEDGLTLTSQINGQVDYISNRVTVMDVFKINGNVDYNTGNIDFVGNVLISGDVSNGFLVRTQGNVHIKGCVDGGVVEAGGNVTIESGFNGHGHGQSNGKVKCGGDLRCKYLQNAMVEVDGNLETTSCINSLVNVGDTAKFMGNQAVLLGSRIVAGRCVEALNIGSGSSSVGTIVEVGSNPILLEEAEEIADEISKTNKTVDSLKQVVTLYEQLAAQNRLTDDQKVEFAKMAPTLTALEKQLMQLKVEKQRVDNRIKGLGFGIVKAFGTAYTGTQIVIGSERRILDTDCQYSQFTRGDDGITISAAQR